MSRGLPSRRMHAVGGREAWDKVLLGLAFAIGVFGGVTLKLLGVHPFVAAGFSALILVVYASLAYWSTSLRLEPEVIGDNSYYLGFLFTLTSLAVTLYFVAEVASDDRALLIPEVISGFGVALVSTLVGVFIRVLMMQFRLDLVAREREARVELDQAARDFRVVLAQSLQQIKLFTVESLQHAAERESAMKRATEGLVQASSQSITTIATSLREDVHKSIKDQSAVAIEEIRNAIAGSSENALTQIRTSFSELGRATQEIAAGQAARRQEMARVDAEMATQLLDTLSHLNTLNEHLLGLAKQLGNISLATRGTETEGEGQVEKIQRDGNPRVAWVVPRVGPAIRETSGED
jgi:hypothetical protein